MRRRYHTTTNGGKKALEGSVGGVGLEEGVVVD